MKFPTSKAIILASIIAPLLLTIGARIVGENIWSALGAIGTIAAVLWAVYHQGILDFLRRPIIQINLYEKDTPHIRPVPVGTPEKPIKSYILTLEILNSGKVIAPRAQPLVTQVRTLKNGQWRKAEGWIPVPLYWVFDELSQISTGKPTDEKDLVPHRPYLFNLGEFSTGHPDNFLLLKPIISRSQKETYEAGEHCFEITVFSLNTEPVPKYVHIKWDGKCTDDFELFKQKVYVQAYNSPIW